MNFKSIPYEQFPHWWICWFYEANYKWDLLTGCMEYQGKVRGKYPYVSFQNEQYTAHWISYTIANWEDPGDLVVRHLCHNKRCGNPLHLAKGTYLQNSQDMVEAGRSQRGARHWTRRLPEQAEALRERMRILGPKSLPSPANHPLTKLTIDQATDIKVRSWNGESEADLAVEFGVTVGNISAIVLGKSWIHAPGPIRPRKENFASKLNPELVRQIRRKAERGMTAYAIAKDLGMSASSIRKVMDRKTWRHITNDGEIAKQPEYVRGVNQWNAKLEDKDIPAIRLRYAKGESFRSIAKDYGVSGTLIRNIVLRITWKHIE